MKTAAMKIQNVKRLQRKEWSEGLKDALYEVRGRGLSLAQIAVDLKVTVPTIELWMRQKRVPKYPALRFIEQIYGVKILKGEN